MSAASTDLETKVLDHVLGGSAYSAPATAYLALFSGGSSDVLAALEDGTNAATAGNWGYYEINNGNYSRVALSFGSASAGSITTNAAATFNAATANYNNTATSGSTVIAIAVIDASTSGNVMFYGLLDNSKEILSGDTFTVSTGNLTISLA